MKAYLQLICLIKCAKLQHHSDICVMQWNYPDSKVNLFVDAVRGFGILIHRKIQLQFILSQN